jgi:hypothetical protein
MRLQNGCCAEAVIYVFFSFFFFFLIATVRKALRTKQAGELRRVSGRGVMCVRVCWTVKSSEKSLQVQL